MKVLAIEDPQDANPQGLYGELRPLHLASREGHVDVAQVFVEHDADAAAQDKDSVAIGVLVWSRGSRLAFRVEPGAYVPS